MISSLDSKHSKGSGARNTILACIHQAAIVMGRGAGREGSSSDDVSIHCCLGRVMSTSGYC